MGVDRNTLPKWEDIQFLLQNDDEDVGTKVKNDCNRNVSDMSFCPLAELTGTG